MSRCRRCNRILTNPAARAAGIGAVCARKEAIYITQRMAEVSDVIVPYHHGQDIFIERERINGNPLDTRIRTNVQRTITRHSPTGFNFGYGGSGPADLALNICAMYLAYEDDVNRCYQSFKFHFCGHRGENDKLVIPFLQACAWFKIEGVRLKDDIEGLYKTVITDNTP